DLVRAGFRGTLSSDDGIGVGGERGDAREASEVAARERADVGLLDVPMPKTDGSEATRRPLGPVGAAHRTTVICPTTHDPEDYLFEALRAGASGFLLKHASPEDLIESGRIVARGDALLSPEVTRRVIARFSAPAVTGPTRRPSELTDREFEVLSLLAKGASNAEIARQLVLGETTVKTHVSRILTKLNLRDRTHAVVFAYENGIVTPGSA